MIVVETSTSASPARNVSILSSSSRSRHLPVRDEHARLGAELAQLLGRLLDRLDAVVEVERLPLARELALERRLDELLVVLADVACGSGGGPRAASRSPRCRAGPASDMCSVRGIGVADSASTSTSSRSWRSSSFCATPKRCSSSTITSPRSFGITSRERTRCVPIRTSTLPSPNSASTLLHLGRLAEARDHLDPHREVAVALAERVPVLLREHRRRHEHQHLLAGDGDRERGAQRDLGLAEADVAADEPVHRARRLEVLLDRLDRARLVLGLAVRELRLEPLDPLLLDVVGDAGPRLALRVELQQLAGHLAQVLAGAGLEVVPGLAAELRERGRVRVGADVARDLADLLVRDEDAVLAAEREQQVVADDAGDLLRLEAEQLRDAVVLVDDVVARAQVGEARERAADRRGRARGALAEDLRVGQQRDRRGRARRSRAAPARRRTRARLAGSSPGASIFGLDAAQQLPLALRLAAVRERDDDVEARPSRPLSSFSASDSPRAASAGRCASNENGWPCGSGSSSVAPVERQLGEPSSAQTPRTSSGCQTRSGARSSGSTRSSGRRRRVVALLVVGERDLDEVDAAARPRRRSSRSRPRAARAA